MSQPAARLGDMTVHGGNIAVGCPTVLIGGKPASRIGDMHICPMVTGMVPHVGGPIVLGSFNVLIGGPPAARQGDMAICVGPPDSIAMGAPTVLIGMAGVGGVGGLLGAILGGVLAGVKNFLGGYPRAVSDPDNPDNPAEYATEYTQDIRIEGSPEFQAGVVSDLDAINNTPSGRRLVDSISQTVTIRETPSGNEYGPHNKVVSYNPNSTQIYDGSEPWMNRPPEVGLAHEMVHASHDVNAGLTTDASGKVSRMFEERRTVGLPAGHGTPDYGNEPFSENSIRRDLGLPERPRYGPNPGDW